MDGKTITWPNSYRNGQNFRLGDVVVQHAPPTVENEHDPTLRVVLAMLMSHANGVVDAAEEVSSSISGQQSGNAIHEANAQLPTTPPADPQVMTKLAELNSAAKSMRDWVGALQKGFADHDLRIRDIETKVGIRR